MRLRGYDTTRSQRGWICDTCFMVETAEQSTAEERCVRTGSQWMWLAMLKGYFAARREARKLRAKPGEREAKGWA